MKLVDLKRKRETKEDEAVPSGTLSKADYPWGTRLSFEDEEIEKVDGLKNAKFKDTVHIEAVGEICSISSHTVEGKERPSTSIQIQIKKIGISKQGQKDISAITLQEALEGAKTYGGK